MSQYKKIARDGANITSKSSTEEIAQDYNNTAHDIRQRFIFFREYYEVIKQLFPMDRLFVYDAVFEYVFYGKTNPVFVEHEALEAFCVIKRMIDTERNKGGA